MLRGQTYLKILDDGMYEKQYSYKNVTKKCASNVFFNFDIVLQCQQIVVRTFDGGLCDRRDHR